MSTLTGKDLNLVKPALTDDYKVTIGTDLPANFQKIDDEFTRHQAESASTSQKGHVQLSTSTTSTSTSLAATASAVKTVNDALTSHKAAAAPHSGHETPAGAQAKAEAAAGAVQAELDMHLSAIATQEQLGHVKAGQNITIDSDGTINAKGGNVDSVNGKTGEVILSASDVGAVPTSRKVNNKALTSNITIDVGDIAGLVSLKLALGQAASAPGNSAVALGAVASAGDYSVALGREASAGRSAVALGAVASAGDYSVALGREASAAGDFSIALGYGVSAENDSEGILGRAGTPYTSTWKVPGSFTVSGTKNFEIPHPKPEKSATHVIRHGAVESPTPGDTLYRWKIQATKDNDLVTIDLPDYFVWLNKDVQIWVTGQGHFGNGYGILNRETEQLEIHCQYKGEYNVLVIGTRNDDHQSVQDWYIKGVEREIGESWTGETYVFSVDEILEVEEIKEVSA